MGVLNKLKCTVPKHILVSLYHALILPHLNFQILNWGQDPAIDEVFNIQKREIRVISRARFLEHTKPLFKTLNLLEFDDLYKLALLKFIYKYEKGSLPAFHQGGRKIYFKFLDKRIYIIAHSKEELERTFRG